MDIDAVSDRIGGDGPDIARYGLGLVLVLVGVHKFIDPGIWASYVAGPFYDLGLDWTRLMWYSSFIEAGIGVGLISGRYRLPFSVLAVGSIAVVVVNIIIAWAYFDLLIRDIGLLVLALVVLADAFDERD